MEAVTVSEALERAQPTRLDHIFPGSWIQRQLRRLDRRGGGQPGVGVTARAREAYDREAPAVSEEQRQLAFEELMIAEGSDWCWWYGPEHHSENRAEFDQLFRDHVANVYRHLDLPAPAELSRPILKTPPAAIEHPPSGLIEAVIDGMETSYFEWMGAGHYKPDRRQGAMHGRPQPVVAMHYGSDSTSLFVRIDFANAEPGSMAGLEVRIRARSGGAEQEVRCLCTDSGAKSVWPARAACKSCFEFSSPLAALGASPGALVGLQVSIWKDQLPFQSLPSQGWIEFTPLDPTAWE